MPLYYLRYLRKESVDDDKGLQGKGKLTPPRSSPRRGLLLGVGIPLALFLLILVVFVVQLTFSFLGRPSDRIPISERMHVVQNQSSKFTIAYPDNWFYTQATFNPRADFGPLAYIQYIEPFRLYVFGTIQRSTIPFNTVNEVAQRAEEFEDSEQTKYSQAVPPEAATLNRTLSLEGLNMKDEQTLVREYTFAQYSSLGLGTVVMPLC
jgi:hypothetical protein